MLAGGGGKRGGGGTPREIPSHLESAEGGEDSNPPKVAIPSPSRESAF